jgi:hypothetical protein
MSADLVKTTKQLSKEAIHRELWIRGDLESILSPVQKELFDIYTGAEDNSTLVWLLARQTGKTFALALFADMTARKYPKCIVNILTDTKLHMEEIILPKFEEIFDNEKIPCPEDLRPRYEKAKYKYHYSNGSTINLAGADGGHFEKMRGKKAKLNIVDEAGFCDKLGEIVMDVLLPTTTHTKGKIILSSTPPKDFDHDFNAYVEAAELEGYLTKKTIFDNTLLTTDQIDKIIKRYPGGINNRSFKREYLCEMLKDPEKSVFPEVDDEMLKVVVREYPKPVYYTPYVGMDIGFKDLTVVVFGYHDFKNNRIVIEREIVKSGPQLKLKDFSEEILQLEELLWTNVLTGEIIDPKIRTSDIEPIITQEIYNHSGARLFFNPVRKERGYKLPLINHIRMMLCDGIIVINPSCKILINHLKNAKWANNQKDDFARSPGNDKENIPASHYDAADALLYMIKGMDFNYNPVPRHARDSQPDFIRNPSTYNHGNSQNSADLFKAIFGKKNRKS